MWRGKRLWPDLFYREQFHFKFQTKTPLLAGGGHVYGATKTLLILSLDLVWNELLRFVLVKDDGQTFILIGSDLTMTPEEMVSLYGRRFKIEVTFKMFKHVIGGFCYHFWTKAWQVPKEESFTLEQVKEW